MSASTWAALCAALVAAACGATAERNLRFRLELAVRADDGAELAGVAVSGNGVHLGVTGPDGVLRADVRAKEGAKLWVQAECPDGYRAPRDRRLLQLRKFRRVEGFGDADLQVEITCSAVERDLALVVKTDGRADLPVLLAGREVARTSSFGVAHVAVRLVPGASFRVQLATDNHEMLRPRNPTVTFGVGGEDTVYVFDQAFTEEKPKPARPARRRKRAAPPAPPAPTRPQKVVSPDARGWRSVR